MKDINQPPSRAPHRLAVVNPPAASFEERLRAAQVSLLADLIEDDMREYEHLRARMRRAAARDLVIGAVLFVVVLALSAWAVVQ